MTRRARLFVVCITALLLAYPVDALADRITLNSGRVLEGAIVQQTAAEYVIKTEIGSIRVPRGDVRGVLSTETLPEEVDAEVALARKDYAVAAQLYHAAMQRSQPGGQAQQRIASRLSQIAQLQQQTSLAAVQTQYEQARALLAARQYDQARQLLEALVPAMPANDATTSAARLMLADAHFNLALQARDSINEIEMVRHLQKGIEAHPGYYRAPLLYGELLLRNSTTEDQGIEMILLGLRTGEGQISDADLVKYHYVIGERLFNAGQYERASQHFAQAIRSKGQYPQYEDALQRTVQSYIKMGESNVASDFEKTITSLNQALQLNPDNADALFLLGRIYKDTGQTDKAIAALEKVLEVAPQYPQANQYLGEAYADARSYEKALAHLDKELNLRRSYDALADRAEVYITMAEYDKAHADLQEAQRLEPNKWRAFLLAAQLFYRLQQYDAARDSLLKVLALKPDALEAHIQMGKVLIAQKQLDAAKQWFSNVVQFLEQSGELSYAFRGFMAEAQTELGAIDLDQESPRQAETRLRQALEMVPNFPPALNRLGDVNRRLGAAATEVPTKNELFREAEKYYQQAIAADPRTPDYYLSLAILYHNNLKQPTEALKNYEKYIELGGKDPEVNKWIVEVGGTPKDLGTTELMTMISDQGSTGTEVTTGTVAGSMGTTASALSVSGGSAAIRAAATSPPGAETNLAPGTGQTTGAAVFLPPPPTPPVTGAVPGQ